MTDEPFAGTGIDTNTPHSARIWNYWLGGKDNYAVDREAGDAWIATNPDILTMAREQRAFLGRVVTHLAGEVGIRQFFDVGTGLPTANNTHEVAQRVAPDARVVYVDNDPLVLAHARALLTSTPEGATRYLPADMNDREGMLAGAAEVLDFTQPVALMFMGVLGHVARMEDARRLVGLLLDQLPPGSYLVTCDGTAELRGQDALDAQDAYNRTGAVPYYLRTPADVASLLDGLDVLEPGVVSVSLWRPDDSGATPITPDVRPEPVDVWGGVGRKP